MNKKTVSAAVAAAAAISAGVYFTTQESSNEESSYTINWEEYLPNIDNYVPNIKSYVPDLDLILPTLPDTQVSVPDIGYSNLPNIEDPDTEMKSIIASAADVPSTSVTGVDIPQTAYDMEVINRAHNRYMEVSQMIRDKRRFKYDMSAAVNESIDKWIDIYKTYPTKAIKKVAIGNKQFRMIAEVQVPRSSDQFEILRDNLAYYKTRGYDSVLVVFDGSEQPSDLRNMVKYLRSLGWTVWFAFSGKESLRVSIFVDPDLFKSQLEAVAEFSEGMLLGWRSTSAHLFDQDPQYTAYMVECARISNPRLKILGEIYYGNTHKYPEAHKYGWGINVPDYSSGAILFNFGFGMVDAYYITHELIPKKVGTMPYVCVVLGWTPYYLTKTNVGRTQEENQKLKERIERSFLENGCVGIITTHDDCSNNIERNKINTNLSETPYTILK